MKSHIGDNVLIYICLEDCSEVFWKDCFFYCVWAIFFYPQDLVTNHNLIYSFQNFTSWLTNKPLNMQLPQVIVSHSRSIARLSSHIWIIFLGGNNNYRLTAISSLVISFFETYTTYSGVKFRKTNHSI